MNLKKTAILYPSGNTTTLVFDKIPHEDFRAVNDFILEKEPSVEVVMFVALDKEMPEGTMAGGELCGNATRSLGYYLLNGKDGEVTIRVSGVPKPLKVNVSSGHSKANIPIPESSNTVEEISSETSLVSLDGISHLVLGPNTKASRKMFGAGTFSERLKVAEHLLKKYHLEEIPTCGIIAVSQSSDGFLMMPYIRSNPLDDWYAETACGSGSLSVALAQAKNSRKSVNQLLLRQPSGHCLAVSVDFIDGAFSNASISGKVDLIYEGSLNYAERPQFVRPTGPAVHKFTK